MENFIKHSDNGFEPLNLWLINRICDGEFAAEQTSGDGNELIVFQLQDFHASFEFFSRKFINKKKGFA